MKIYNIKDKQEYIKEVVILTKNTWGKKCNSNEEYNNYVDNKIISIKNKLVLNNYACLILLDEDILVGFISLFPTDGEYHKELTPWYATMYVKEKYRGKGYSKILNDAILKETKQRGYDKIYLKTDLNNYYEKFGFKYMETMPNKEKLYYKDL